MGRGWAGGGYYNPLYLMVYGWVGRWLTYNPLYFDTYFDTDARGCMALSLINPFLVLLLFSICICKVDTGQRELDASGRVNVGGTGGGNSTGCPLMDYLLPITLNGFLSTSLLKHSQILVVFKPVTNSRQAQTGNRSILTVVQQFPVALQILKTRGPTMARARLFTASCQGPVTRV